mmetsp:Transcript_23989/g.64342  ORF Transcript_23989/g.64342 Transcript_23989/m.64342 type:complete len:210 (-) Transcript_23989:270-899(-)
MHPPRFFFGFVVEQQQQRPQRSRAFERSHFSRPSCSTARGSRVPDAAASPNGAGGSACAPRPSTRTPCRSAGTCRSSGRRRPPPPFGWRSSWRPPRARAGACGSAPARSSASGLPPAATARAAAQAARGSRSARPCQPRPRGWRLSGRDRPPPPRREAPPPRGRRGWAARRAATRSASPPRSTSRPPARRPATRPCRRVRPRGAGRRCR